MKNLQDRLTTLFFLEVIATCGEYGACGYRCALAEAEQRAPVLRTIVDVLRILHQLMTLAINLDNYFLCHSSSFLSDYFEFLQ